MKADPGGNVEQTLMQMEREITSALIKGDTATLERMWAEGYSFTNPGGEVMKKAEYIEALKSGALKFETLDLADMKVRVNGDTAEVTGRVTVKGKFKDEAFSEVDSYTNVYAKQQGQWQQVSTKVTSGTGQQTSEQQSPPQQPTQQPTQEKPTQQQPTQKTPTEQRR